MVKRSWSRALFKKNFSRRRRARSNRFGASTIKSRRFKYRSGYAFNPRRARRIKPRKFYKKRFKRVKTGSWRLNYGKRKYRANYKRRTFKSRDSIYNNLDFVPKFFNCRTKSPWVPVPILNSSALGHVASDPPIQIADGKKQIYNAPIKKHHNTHLFASCVFNIFGQTDPASTAPRVVNNFDICVLDGIEDIHSAADAYIPKKLFDRYQYFKCTEIIFQIKANYPEYTSEKEQILIAESKATRSRGNHVIDIIKDKRYKAFGGRTLFKPQELGLDYKAFLFYSPLNNLSPASLITTTQVNQGMMKPTDANRLFCVNPEIAMKWDMPHQENHKYRFDNHKFFSYRIKLSKFIPKTKEWASTHNYDEVIKSYSRMIQMIAFKIHSIKNSLFFSNPESLFEMRIIRYFKFKGLKKGEGMFASQHMTAVAQQERSDDLAPDTANMPVDL